MAGGKSPILLVTASDSLAQSLSQRLAESGYRVVVAAHKTAVLAEIQEKDPLLIIVDRQFPWYQDVRQSLIPRGVPLIAFQPQSSACLEEDCIEDLNLGMDDTVCGQSPAQLVARIRAILRRQQVSRESPAVLRIGDISMDLERHEVTVRGRQIDLTPKEFQILQCFLESPSRVFSRQEMLDLVWGPGYALEAHALDVHIHALRQKIEANPSRPQCIVTVRGLGYKLRAG
ncbi:MAG: response regulator transcription factor [Nitrospirota bacterium]